ncbi:MAG TPA: alpha/beta hydrolase [Bryobacteraceae bacterium]|nr:alpha/beta hydrolase [Bryobacteraceae bacterium]
MSQRPTPAKVRSQTPPLGESAWLTAHKIRIKAKIYHSAKRIDQGSLIVVIHGDLLEANVQPTYHYQFARKATETNNNVTAAALLRPGYTDGDGDQSTGRKGLATGDNYTPEVVDAIADAVGELQARFQPTVTVMVGHSGGAAIVGDLLGRRPSQINGALLVSCPCDVPLWRRYMLKAQFGKVGPFSLLFLVPVNSLSPIDFVSKVSPSVRVRMIVGSQDSTAPARFTQEYARALQGHDVDTTVTVGEGLGHNILLEGIVFDQLTKLLAETTRAAGASRDFHR